MKVLIGMDHGNRNIKTANFVFTSGYTVSRLKPTFAQTDTIFYDGNYYTIAAEAFPFALDKTETENFFVLTLFGIVKELDAKGMTSGEYEVKLGVGLPPRHLAALRDKFGRYFKERDKAKVQYKNRTYEIKISDALVFPQCFSAMAAFGEKEKSIVSDFESCLLVDIGGYTVDIVEMRDGRPAPDKCLSLELGVNKMVDEISSNILNDYTYQVSPTMIENILKHSGKRTMLPDEVVCDIRRQSEEWVNKILNKIREHGYDTRIIPVIFMGGGVSVFADAIDGSSLLGIHEKIENICINALGYEKACRMVSVA